MVIVALFQVKMSYMAVDSLTYLPGFSVEFFFPLIYTDYVYLEKQNHIKIFSSEI